MGEVLYRVWVEKQTLSGEVLHTSESIEFKADFLTWAKSLFREFIMSIRLCPVGEVISGYIVSARFTAQGSTSTQSWLFYLTPFKHDTFLQILSELAELSKRFNFLKWRYLRSKDESKEVVVDLTKISNFSSFVKKLLNNFVFG